MQFSRAPQIGILAYATGEEKENYRNGKNENLEFSVVVAVEEDQPGSDFRPVELSAIQSRF
ncbi:hypothetical protein L195_g008363 [Trifolium pratense]|uniref:Uncharacterized protein n=1 Tax=Trifolium pratense TaxID=57577 RepID=A0A2K3P8Z1_TRIPR|nr:hypothetical protein L195_g008363 [Trifolium pratense]